MRYSGVGPILDGRKYRHMGQFAQLGGGRGGGFTGGRRESGMSTMLLWYGAYFSEQISEEQVARAVGLGKKSRLWTR